MIDRLARHHRLAAGIGILSAFGMVAAFAVAPDSDSTQVPLQVIVERLAASPVQIISPDPAAAFLREELVQRGDTLADLFARLGIHDKQAFEFIRTDSTAQTVARQLRPGKLITSRTTEHGELLALHFPLNGKDAILAIERNQNHFSVKERLIALESRTELRSGEIRYSLFGATDAAGIPDSVATQLAEIFSGDIDFHRDLRKGDRFNVVYETLYLHGQPYRGGRILAAEFTNDQKTYQAYWHAGSGSTPGGYYSAEGKSLRKAFLRSPLEFSRVTSGFTSSRFHPVLQTWRAHKGIDYGAPIGTRVRAVADGTIASAGAQGGYGNLVVINHHGSYSTAYGHLNGFAPGIRKGARVTQGETIGYVGKTGLASGPHLHYEFRVRNQQVNPLAIAMPSAPPLSQAEKARFLASTEALRNQIRLAKDSLDLAAASVE